MDYGTNLKIYMTQKIDYAFGIEVGRDWGDEILATDERIAQFILCYTNKCWYHEIFTAIEIDDIHQGFSMNDDGSFVDLEDGQDYDPPDTFFSDN